MEEFLSQIEKTLQVEAYYAALFLCLCVPDICGALDSSNGEASGDKYKAWYKKYMFNKFMLNDPWALSYEVLISADEVYKLRCAALHQGTLANTSTKSKSQYARIIFQEPGQKRLIAHGVTNMSTEGKILYLNLEEFCIDMVYSAQKWFADKRGAEPFETNYKKNIKRYPNGLQPYCSGFPIIT